MRKNDDAEFFERLVNFRDNRSVHELPRVLKSREQKRHCGNSEFRCIDRKISRARNGHIDFAVYHAFDKLVVASKLAVSMNVYFYPAVRIFLDIFFEQHGSLSTRVFKIRRKSERNGRGYLSCIVFLLRNIAMNFFLFLAGRKNHRRNAQCRKNLY